MKNVQRSERFCGQVGIMRCRHAAYVVNELLATVCGIEWTADRKRKKEEKEW